MGGASKAVSVVFRLMQLISASIVAGVLGNYLHYVSQAHAHMSGRVVYAISIAGIAIFFSLVLMVPLRYSFFAFPFDFAMFVAWMVAFGLLVNVRSYRIPFTSFIKRFVAYKKLIEIGSSSEVEVVIQTGIGATAATTGVDGIIRSQSQRSHKDRSGLVHVIDGEQLSPGRLSEVSSGCSASVWQVFLSLFLAFVLFLQNINTSEGHLRYRSKQKQASTSH